MSFIAIDLGASFIKGALICPEELKLRKRLQLPFPDFRRDRPPFHREVEVGLIVKAVGNILRDLCKDETDVRGIFVCGQMHGLVFSDVRGQALTDFISWQDRRALETHPSGRGTYFDLLYDRITSDERVALGNELRPGLPLCLLWVLSENGALPKERCFPVSLPDFVAAHLCGTEPRTESTNASAHGALEIASRAWHVDVIARLGFDRLAWPTLQEFFEPVGTLRVGRSDIPCYTPVGDQQAALAGAGIEEGELSVNVGTGSQVSMLSDKVRSGDHQSRPYFDGLFLDTVTHIPAGRALNALVRLLIELAESEGVRIADPWFHIARAVDRTRFTDIEIALDFFPGVFGSEGRIEHIHEENLTVGNLFRAAFERMAENYGKAAEIVSGGRPYSSAVFSGGLVRKLPELRDVIVRRLGLSNWRICPTEEESLLGLLALSLVVSGRAVSVRAAASEVRSAFS